MISFKSRLVFEMAALPGKESGATKMLPLIEMKESLVYQFTITRNTRCTVLSRLMFPVRQVTRAVNLSVYMCGGGGGGAEGESGNLFFLFQFDFLVKKPFKSSKRCKRVCSKRGKRIK